MSELRVLIVGLNYAPEPTGIAPYTAGLARGLEERGHEVDVITTFPHYPEWRISPDWPSMSRREDATGVAVRRVRHYVPSDPTGGRRAASEISYGLRAAILRWDRPDVVVCPSPALLGSAIALLRVAATHPRPALGVVAQDLYSAGAQQAGGYGSFVTRALAQVERQTLHRADGVVAIHDRFKRRMVDHLGLPEEAVTVIRNWTHIDDSTLVDRDRIRSRMGWGAQEFVVLHTGAMGEKQGLQNVVDAARLAQRLDVALRFVLVGDGGQRPALERAGGGIHSLQFLPPVPQGDYPSLLSAADLLLVNEKPGVSDMAVPSKLTSYFHSGVAVLAVTEPLSTTAEEVALSGAGVVVDPGDPQKLVDAVQALAANPEHRRRTGANGPSYCAKVLSEKAALDAYEDWVRGLVTRRHGARA